MKLNFNRLILLTTFLGFFTAGCVGPQKPPSKLEQSFFDIHTNQTPTFTSITNYVIQTNIIDSVPVYITNVVVELKTELVPSYTFTPNTNASAVIETGGLIGSLFGTGGIVTTILASFFGLYASLRSKKQGEINNNLAQAIETARSILLTTPKGQELDKEFVAWLVKYQTEAGIVQQVADIVSNVVDAPAADEVAAAIKALLTKPQA